VRADVRQLLSGIGAEDLRYWDPGDPAPEADAGPAAAAASDAPAGIAVAFASPFEGAGRTSLAATFVTLLAHSGAPCGAVDLDRDAPLVRRLGGAPDPLGRAAACGEAAGALSEGRFGVRCLAVADPARLGASASASGVRQALHEALGRPEWMVLDGMGDAAQLRLALSACDELVVVLRPGDAGEAGLDAVERWLSDAGCGRAGWLVNRYDGRDAQHRAARAALRARAAGRLLPFVVDEEPAFGELEGGATLVEAAPESQVLRILADLAARIRRGVAASPGAGGA
jgi:cellulose biosynthesis protein BcsQ